MGKQTDSNEPELGQICALQTVLRCPWRFDFGLVESADSSLKKKYFEFDLHPLA
jgi:hypothetical protein